jgi:hypothetical protein
MIAGFAHTAALFGQSPVDMIQLLELAEADGSFDGEKAEELRRQARELLMQQKRRES